MRNYEKDRGWNRALTEEPFQLLLKPVYRGAKMYL